MESRPLPRPLGSWNKDRSRNKNESRMQKSKKVGGHRGRGARFYNLANARIKSAHVPVLLNEVLEILEPSAPLRQGYEGQGPPSHKATNGQLKVIVDGTVGGGGHAIPIMERLTPNGVFIGIDWDGTAVEKLEERSKKYASRLKKLILKTGNYADLSEILKSERIGKVSGVLLDLGFSSEQLESGRGFSFAKDEPLVMTYSKDRLPAHRALAQLSKTELTEIIRTYGEERYAGRIAGAIWEKERKQAIKTSGELQRVIRQAVPDSYERGRINPATRTFMALRIYLNDELGNLERFLESVPEVMAKGGRVAIISFHSLEDRLVKNHFRELVKENKAKLINKKPIIPTSDEIKANPRARSAKLRAVEMR